MKPILHIIKTAGDTQALEVIRKQSGDNSYGITVVFLDDAGLIPFIPFVPSIPNVRMCILQQSGIERSDSSEITPPVEWISYDDLLDLIFSVESIAVWS